MSASVIPSLKYSCAGSPVRLARGSTASERMRGWSGASAFRRSTGVNEISNASNAAAASAPASHFVRPRPGPVRGVVSGARGSGASAAALGSTALDLRQEPVPALGQSLHEARRRGRVAQRLADLVDRHVQRGVELDERVLRPQGPPKLVAGHDIARTADEDREDLGGLVLEGHTLARSPQLARGAVELEGAEPDDDRRHAFRRRAAPDVSDEAVSARRHRLQVAWLGRRVAERLAQLRDHARQRALADRRVLPQGVQQLLFPDQIRPEFSTR